MGDLLRRYRELAGLSQEALAERAGMSPRGLVYLERGMRRPFAATWAEGKAMTFNEAVASALNSEPAKVD
ncbi:MAG TPA: helix-turn-helix transcriptional regulator [Chloroflexota bacterium]